LNAPAAYFADTSFWIALSHKSDEHHGRASDWSRYLIQKDASILTTEAVLWEWMNALADSGTRRTTAEGYRRCHQDPHIEVVPLAADTIAAGGSIVTTRDEASR
jgi:predicted nucleic acid-binding protein